MKLIHNFTMLTALTFATFSCYGMESDEFNSLKDDSTKKPLTSMELAKQYGYIGSVIKRIGTAYNEDGTSNNNPLPDHVTNLIIEFVKRSLACTTSMSFEIDIPQKLYYCAFNPIKPEIAFVVYEDDQVIIKGPNYSYELPKPTRTNEGPPAHFHKALKYNPQGTLLCQYCVFGGLICIWDVKTQQISHMLYSLHGNNILFNTDGNKLINRTKQDIFAWDLLTNKKHALPNIRNEFCAGIQYFCKTPDGKIFAHKQPGGLLRWNLDTELEVNCIPFDDYIVKFKQMYPLTNSVFEDENSQSITIDDLCIDDITHCPSIDKYFFIIKDNDFVKLYMFDQNSNSFTKIHTLNAPHPNYTHDCDATTYKFSDDGTKFMHRREIEHEQGTTQLITYIDLVPDLNKFTIEQLRAMANGKI